MSQVREPYTSVGYLACRVPLVWLLGLRHPNPDDPRPQHRSTHGGVCEGVREEEKGKMFDGQLWTAWDVCDGERCEGVRGMLVRV